MSSGDRLAGIVREGKKNTPVITGGTWPNSGIGRPKHSFESKLTHALDNCGKSHLGLDHPRIDSYNESNHGSRTKQWQISGKNPIMYPKAGGSGETAIRVSPAP